MKVFQHTTGIYCFIFRLGLKALLKVQFNRYLCIVTALILISCATPPKETYLTKANLSNISKVAIVASASAPEVTYSSSGIPVSLAFAGLIGILPGIIEGTVRSGMDTVHAQQIGKRVDLTSIEDKISDVFSESIIHSGCFKNVERIKNTNQDEQLLSTSGYDAIIRLTVHEISLDSAAGDYVDLHIHVNGQLKHLRSGNILWDREEMIKSPESHSLDYYKENGLRELDKLLEKAGKRLAYDFTYSK